jgi:isoleucyl-tRNA synthetase
VELLVLLRALRERRRLHRAAPTDSADPLDRYLLAKTHQYVADMTRQLDDYEIANACDSTRSFLDVLSNWYIRRSRERFWAPTGRSTSAPSTRSTPCSRPCAASPRRCCR